MFWLLARAPFWFTFWFTSDPSVHLAMLRYFAYGVRDFSRSPDLSDFRLNWEFIVTFRHKISPVFPDDPQREEPAANFWVMPPKLRYHWNFRATKVERTVFHFTFVPEPLEELVRWQGGFHRQLTRAELAEIRHIAMAVDSAMARRDRLSPLHFQHALLDLTLLALRREVAKVGESTLETQVADRVECAVAWYREHLAEAPKLQRVAAALHLSVSHLRRLFHIYYRRSPKAVFDRVRLETAASLLATSTATLETVSGRTGFHSVTDFCRVFKKRFGHSPDEWRRTKVRARPGAVGPTG
jgi:AraC-like DNA-binding protein